MCANVSWSYNIITTYWYIDCEFIYSIHQTAFAQ